MYNGVHNQNDSQEALSQSHKQVLFRENDVPIMVSWTSTIPEAHYHAETEFSIAIRGSGRYFVKDTAYDLSPGSGLMVHGDDVHYGIPSDKGGNLLRVVIMFSQTLLEARPTALNAISRLNGLTAFALNSTETNNVEQLLRNIEDEIAAKRENWLDIVICQLERFVLIVSRAATSSLSNIKKSNPLVKEVIARLNETYARKQFVEDIAKEFCISPSALRRTFKQETGLGIKEFIIRIRINAAKKLLEDSNAKVAAVAYSVGYDSLSAFNREFRLVTGVSPSNYRKSSND